jgi:hypothetical protein
LTRRLSYSLILTLLFLGSFWSSLWAQEERDTTVKDSTVVRDTTVRPIDTTLSTAEKPLVIQSGDARFLNHSPRKATIRSAIIPGWGQAYNRQIWKIPIVYAALGTTAGVFVYNIQNYRDFRFAYQAKYKATPRSDNPRPTLADSADFFRMKPEFQSDDWDLESIRYYRNEFRKNVDYSVLVFLIFWGLNVADAAAAAHLRTFDVSPDLSFQIKPGYSEMANTRGLSLVLAFK